MWPPADEAVAAAQVTRRRAPREAGDRSLSGIDETLQMLADGLRIAQIGVLLKQAFEQGFFWRAPDLTHFQGPQFGKVDLQRRFVYPDQRRRPASGLRVI